MCHLCENASIQVLGTKKNGGHNFAQAMVILGHTEVIEHTIWPVFSCRLSGSIKETGQNKADRFSIGQKQAGAELCEILFSLIELIYPVAI